ncbi:hypothetical protein Tco_1502477 [Tanacetum coccineum]
MTLDIHNWSYSAHQEIHKIVKDEILPIVKQVDARVQNFEIQFLKEAGKFVRDFKSLEKEADESLAKHKDLELEIERLLKAVVSQGIMSIVQNTTVVETSDHQTELEYTLDPLSQKLENENVELEFQIKNYVKENAQLKTAYKNLFDSINLSDKVSKQKDTTKGVDITTKTKRPQPRSNTNNDRVLYASKSRCIKNKEVEVEEHHRNLLFSKNKKPMSSECNNVKLAIQNDKSEVVCAMCKKCLITANHDVCMFNYVNGMNSHGKKQKANVSNTENQKKQKPQVKKPKKVGSKERLASPTPTEPSICRRWSPTCRIFDCNGKIIKSNASKGQFDNSNGDDACTSNPQEPSSKRFPNSTYFLGRFSKFVYGASTRVVPSI